MEGTTSRDARQLPTNNGGPYVPHPDPSHDRSRTCRFAAAARSGPEATGRRSEPVSSRRQQSGRTCRVTSACRRVGQRCAAGRDARAHSLAVAEINGCNYCLSAHTYLGKNFAKLDDAEITANRNGASNDPKADAAVRFAAKVARERGHVSDDDVRAVKLAGYNDAQVIEIVLHVALNTWTNYINEVAKTDIDFPVVTTRKAA